MPNPTLYNFVSLNASDYVVPTENLKDAYIHGVEDTTFAATRARAKAKVQRAREALRRADVVAALRREAKLKDKDAEQTRAMSKVQLYRAALYREAKLKAKDAEQAKRIAELNAIRNVKVPTAGQYQEHQYQGHHADGGGVQNHSAGGLYPYILAVRTARNGQGYEYGVLGGVLLDTVWVGSYDRATALALYFKANAKGFTI